MPRKPKKIKSEPEIIADRLAALSYSSLCESGCWGRCRDCPAEAIEEAINYLRTIPVSSGGGSIND